LKISSRELYCSTAWAPWRSPGETRI